MRQGLVGLVLVAIATASPGTVNAQGGAPAVRPEEPAIGDAEVRSRRDFWRRRRALLTCRPRSFQRFRLVMARTKVANGRWPTRGSAVMELNSGDMRQADHPIREAGRRART